MRRQLRVVCFREMIWLTCFISSKINKTFLRTSRYLSVQKRGKINAGVWVQTMSPLTIWNTLTSNNTEHQCKKSLKGSNNFALTEILSQ